MNTQNCLYHRNLTSPGVKTYIDGDRLNRDVPLTFSLVQSNNWRPLYYRDRLHIEHIFPESRVKELPNEAKPFTDSVWNKYIVFQGDNLSKGITLPEDYFVGEKEKLIDDYLLPKGNKFLLREDVFNECLKLRQGKIQELFKERLGLSIRIPETKT